MNPEDRPVVGAEFTGWAIVQIMGHQKVAGFVTTHAFGSVVMFRVHAPAVAPVDQVTDKDHYLNYKTIPAGSKLRISRDEFDTYVGAGSIYRLDPCTEEKALALIPQRIEILELATRLQIVPGTQDPEEPEEGEDDYEDAGSTAGF
jgi:hypothetical protein